MFEKFISTSTKELYDRICNTSQLCGKFELFDNTIFWKLFSNIPDSITHWHPEHEDVYQEILNIGSAGNVVVIRKNILFDGVIYMGKEENCPYPLNIKWHFGKIYYLKVPEMTE